MLHNLRWLMQLTPFKHFVPSHFIGSMHAPIAICDFRAHQPSSIETITLTTHVWRYIVGYMHVDTTSSPKIECQVSWTKSLKHNYYKQVKNNIFSTTTTLRKNLDYCCIPLYCQILPQVEILLLFSLGTRFYIFTIWKF